MRAPYHHLVRKEAVFCRHCSAVTMHMLYSRIDYSLDDPELLKENLLGNCMQCFEDQVILASDLRSLVADSQSEFSCKIAGRSRIVVGDWVYFPGQSKPGRVKFRTRLENREQYVMEFDDGKEFKWSQKSQNIGGKEASSTFKLLPFQLGSTLIGDFVYHVGRDLTGVAVGIVHSEQAKLIVQLENRSYLLMNLENRRTETPNNRLLREKIQEAFRSVLGESSGVIQIEVREGIIYLNGECGHLLEREALIQFAESIPGVLMVLPKISIRPEIEVSDEELQSQIQTLLSTGKKNQGVIGIRVQVQSGIAHINGYVTDEESMERLAKQISCINGLRNIKLNLEITEELRQEDLERAQLVNNALLKNNTLANCSVHAHCRSGVIHLEGTVRSIFQKNTATLATAWVAKNINIVNNIRIEKHNPPSNQMNIT